MNTNVLIICESIYNNNTFKIASSMAKKLTCSIVNCEKASSMDLSAYKYIGLGSGIYFTQHHTNLINIVDKLGITNQKAFIFSTHGRPYLGGYHNTLKEKLSSKGIEVIGEFSTPGYDCTGPYNLYGGGNKGKPNEKDVTKAARFISKLLPQYIKDTSKTTNGMHVQIDNTTCIKCGNCVSTCPMKIINLSNNYVSVISDDNCVHCNLCTDNCPSQSISIQHNWKELIGIAFKHSKKIGL